MKYYRSKYLYNETGFTLIEVLLATVILAILSLPIFYSSLQATNNYVSAEKYYEATLDAENILTEIKASLDTKIQGLSGSNTDIDSIFIDDVKKTKTNEKQHQDLNGMYGLFTGISGLELDTSNKYNYEVYLKKIDTAVPVNILNANFDDANGVYKFKHGFITNLTTEDIPMVVSGLTPPSLVTMDVNGNDIVPGTNITVAGNILKSSIEPIGIMDTLKLEYTVNSAVANPINISTHGILPTNIPGVTQVKLVVRNYDVSKVDINLFTHLNHDPKKDTLVSYDKSVAGVVENAGSIQVVSNKGTLPVPEYSYAIVVVVTDNRKGNKVLVQLTDVYSYVPKG